MWFPGSRGLNIFQKKHLLSTEHLLCVGCAKSWEINFHEGKVGFVWHFYEHCALPAPSPLGPALWWAGFALLPISAMPGPGHISWWEHAALSPRRCVYSLSWPLALGMTGSVIDMFISVATRRGGRTGQSCLSRAVPSPILLVLQGGECFRKANRSNPLLKGKDCMGKFSKGQTVR